MRTKFILSVLCVLLCYACPIGGGLAKATDITIAISGTVTSASGSALPSTIYGGVGFTGTYTYDTNTPDSDPATFAGRYYFNSPYGINLSLGGYEFKTVPSHVGQFEITIVDVTGANSDMYKIISNENTSVNGTTIEYIWWGLGGPPSTISSIALPVSEPATIAELTDWVSNVLEISGQNLLIQGTVTQAEIIPEPLTGALMAIGVFFLRRRR